MKNLKPKDFEGLTVPKYEEKLKKTDDLALLSELEKIEAGDAARKGVLSAINERQGELMEEKDYSTPTPPVKDTAKEEEKPAPDSPIKKEMDKFVSEQEEEIEDADSVSESFKNARMRLDAALQFCKAHEGIPNTPDELLFLSREWIGKSLEELNKFIGKKPQPYTKVNEGVDFEVKTRQFKNFNTSEAIAILDKTLIKIADQLSNVRGYNFGREFSICRTNAWSKVCEARFHLKEIKK